MIVVNFKNYKRGKEALKLARSVEKFLGRNAIVCLRDQDIERVTEGAGLKVYSQFYSPAEGKRQGTLLNHSDYRISISEIRRSLLACEREGLEVILCAATLGEIKKFLSLKVKPMAIAFEDSKLIGSGESITKYRAEDVGRFALMLKGTGILPYCGAGISDADDVREAYRLGCEGVLIASAIANVDKPERILKEIAEVEK